MRFISATALVLPAIKGLFNAAVTRSENTIVKTIHFVLGIIISIMLCVYKRRNFIQRRDGTFCFWPFMHGHWLVTIHKWPICSISALFSKFIPRNINHMPADEFYARLDLNQICLFLDEH
jgi:hypothetical protein